MSTGRTSPSCLALCVGAVLGPIAGLAMVPFAFVGAACALMCLVLACVHVQGPPIAQLAVASERQPSTEPAVVDESRPRDTT
jgi:hypothetical protein